MMKTGVKLSDHICNRESLVLPELGSGDDQMMTPETSLDPSASGESGGASAGEMECQALASIASAEIVKKKRSIRWSVRSPLRPDCGAVSEVPAAVMNRRKKPPHRSPLQ